MDDVTADLVEKLIRRNPHVFGPAAGGPSGLRSRRRPRWRTSGTS
ncbi:hypothetical protein [Actinopolymorpha singaporensis]|nr:hypothetical protein [Actinopolymorpha singaporensis]